MEQGSGVNIDTGFLLSREVNLPILSRIQGSHGLAPQPLVPRPAALQNREDYFRYDKQRVRTGMMSQPANGYPETVTNDRGSFLQVGL